MWFTFEPRGYSFSIPVTGTSRTASLLRLKLLPTLLEIENRTDLTSELTFSLWREGFGFKVKCEATNEGAAHIKATQSLIKYDKNSAYFFTEWPENDHILQPRVKVKYLVRSEFQACLVGNYYLILSHLLEVSMFSSKCRSVEVTD